MDVSAFSREMDAAKAEFERSLGINRYPYQTLDNVKLVEKLFAEAKLPWPPQGPILDVGCGDGDFGFYFSRMGRAVDFIDFEETNQNQMRMVRSLAARLPGSHKVTSLDIDRGLAGIDGTYNFAISLGLLYHLKNPFLYLEDLAARSSFAAVSTRVVDSKVLPDKLAGAYLVNDQELGADNTNYWLFNSAGFARLAERSGWKILSRHRFGDRKGDAARQDAREALLLASRYSVFDGVRLTHGLHRLEFQSYRWTEPRFGVVIERPVRWLDIDYHLPEQWCEGHSIRVPAGLGVELHEGRARIALPQHNVPYELEIEVDPPRQTHTDQRELGIVLRLNGAKPPLRLIP